MIPTAIGTGIIAASFGASFGSLYLLQYLYHQRDRSGAAWFMGNIAAVAVFCAAYPIGLLVFTPSLRIALGAVSFIALSFMGPFFLAFGLDYTGRGDFIRSPLFSPVAGVPLLTVVLTATNPIHQLVWTNFQIDPAFRLATATYTVQPWGVFALLFSIGTAAVGSLLLIGAIVSYGPLYRREAIAVILSTAPPTVGVSVWLLEIGPVPQLHLTAPLMLVHVALDGYAFVGTHMFRTNPATQRMAEQTGLDSLPNPVVILDMEQQIVRINDRAAALFPNAVPDALPVSVESVLGVDIATLRDAGDLQIESDEGGTFAISETVLTDPGGSPVGRMIALYDVTEDRQREQQLAVLNRVLRHNLRNETTLISGYTDLLKNTLEDPDQEAQAKTIEDASDRLRSISEKGKTFKQIQQRDAQPTTTTASAILADVTQDCTEAHSDATIESTVTPSTLEFQTDTMLLSVVFTNLIENALVHSDDPTPTVTVRASKTASDGGEVVFEIRDDNDRIPAMEIDALRVGDETPLQHGQGIGLWIVYWCLQKLRGEIDFEYNDGNVLRVTVPDMAA
ncbi:HTR-like protein [Halorubrum coriense DSM 10284]|uniref:histidine kinase n=1 Tax=Halorubrum coriense DSM 10284 TaxID=1227466 RepID=M0EAV1_9EURY|nr:histidine kinase N-terminal 7TM domain-containing protein [Halorubrum coriense]ELZ44900.1 HTR-like protein [Halorubrum coriense DSM 10284]